MRAKITRRARTVTEGPPMGDPRCIANRPIRVENCWPMEIGQKPESCLKAAWSRPWRCGQWGAKILGWLRRSLPVTLQPLPRSDAMI